MSDAKSSPLHLTSRDGEEPHTALAPLLYNIPHPLVTAFSGKYGPQSFLGRLTTERRSQKHTYTSFFFKASGAYP